MNDKTEVKVERKQMSGKSALLSFLGILAGFVAVAIAPAVVIAAWNWLL